MLGVQAVKNSIRDNIDNMSFMSNPFLIHKKYSKKLKIKGASKIKNIYCLK
jgi:hypothetical protein